MGMLTWAFNIQPVKPSTEGVYFLDYFDGTAVDTTKWQVSTGPPRFKQHAGPSDLTGFWTTPTGDPHYGIVSVSNSWVSLWNGYSTVFPYVMSQINPFPDTGNFVLEFMMRYDSVNVAGIGFVVRYADSENPLTNHIFSVWQDSSVVPYLTIQLLGAFWQGAVSDT